MVQEKPPENQVDTVPGKEHEPKIHLEFFFAAHGSREDLKGIQGLLGQTDLIAIEAPGWDDQTPAQLNAESLRDKEDHLSGEDTSGQYSTHDAIRGLKKPIIPIDVESNSKAFDKVAIEFQEVGQFLEKSRNAFLDGRNEDVLQFVKQAAESFAKSGEIREHHVRNQLKNMRGRIAKEFPELSDKPELNVLVIMGFEHTDVHHALSKEGLSTSLHFGSFGVRSRDSLGEIVMRMRKGLAIPDRLYLCYPIEIMLYDNWKRLTQDTLKILSLIRAITKKLSDNDIQALYRQMKFATWRDTRVILDFLEEKNIKFPKRPEDVDHLLKKRYRMPGYDNKKT